MSCLPRQHEKVLRGAMIAYHHICYVYIDLIQKHQYFSHWQCSKMLSGQLTRFRNKVSVALKSLPVSSWWMRAEKLGSSPHQKSQSSRRPCLWLRLHTLSTSAFRQRLKLQRMGSSSVTGTGWAPRSDLATRTSSILSLSISLWEREIALASVSKAVRSPTLKSHIYSAST